MSTETKSCWRHPISGDTPWSFVTRNIETSDVHYAIEMLGYVGYHGNRDRNYITDAWLDRAASSLGWTAQMVLNFGTSTMGRHFLDQRPMSYPAFKALLADRTEAAQDDFAYSPGDWETVFALDNEWYGRQS